jgi:hypothetical protein
MSAVRSGSVEDARWPSENEDRQVFSLQSRERERERGGGAGAGAGEKEGASASGGGRGRPYFVTTVQLLLLAACEYLHTWTQSQAHPGAAEEMHEGKETRERRSNRRL